LVELRADEIFGCLGRHGVRYVVIGGLFDLVARALTMRVKDWDVRVASLEDVIRSKEAAARPKDQRSLPVLRQLLEAIRARRGESKD
jgi:hypothetical protein